MLALLLARLASARPPDAEALLRSCGIDTCPDENIVELANGCLCCTVADDFIPTVETLLALDPRPDHILIETSGLALPKPLLTAGGEDEDFHQKV